MFGIEWVIMFSNYILYCVSGHLSFHRSVYPSMHPTFKLWFDPIELWNANFHAIEICGNKLLHVYWLRKEYHLMEWTQIDKKGTPCYAVLWTNISCIEMWSSRLGATQCHTGFQNLQETYNQLPASNGTFIFIRNIYYLLIILGRHSLRYQEYKDTYVISSKLEGFTIYLPGFWVNYLLW